MMSFSSCFNIIKGVIYTLVSNEPPKSVINVIILNSLQDCFRAGGEDLFMERVKS